MVRSVHDVAMSANIYIRYNTVISGKLKCQVTLVFWRCQIPQLLLCVKEGKNQVASFYEMFTVSNLIPNNFLIHFSFSTVIFKGQFSCCNFNIKADSFVAIYISFNFNLNQEAIIRYVQGICISSYIWIYLCLLSRHFKFNVLNHEASYFCTHNIPCWLEFSEM
jgi:hypothetical protein